MRVQIVKNEVVLLLNRVGPVGVDAKTLCIGDDQQRRIFERHRIELKLLIGAVEASCNRFTSSANRQKTRRLRKCATIPRRASFYATSSAIRTG